MICLAPKDHAIGCPVCESADNSLFYEKSPRLLICHECRHIFWEQFPSAADIYRYYADKYSFSHDQSRIQLANVPYYKRHLDELRTLHGDNPRSIADIGCSFPHLLIEAKKAGFSECYGVEWDVGSIEMGVANGVVMLKTSELGEIPDLSIDIARFSHVIEHALKPFELLVSLYGKMKPGAIVYITQPSFPVLRADKSLFDIKDSVYPEHLHFFSPISLAMLIERSGFQIISFFTHQNAAANLEAMLDSIDAGFALKKMIALRNLGDSSFGVENNYPIFAGDNSVAVARKG